jgi:hypothetical protein
MYGTTPPVLGPHFISGRFGISGLRGELTMMLRRRIGFVACTRLLAAGALVGVLWAGSYRSIAQARLPVAGGATRWEFTSYRGLLAIGGVENYPFFAKYCGAIHAADATRAQTWDHLYWDGSFAGFGAEEGMVYLPNPVAGGEVARRWSCVILPYWLLFVLAAVLPIQEGFVALRARVRWRHGQCGACGYEVGADADVCPACAARTAVLGVTPHTHVV